jgi:hypothetical protein
MSAAPFRDILYRDMLFVCLMMFVVMVILMLPFINDPKEHQATDEPPGSIIFAITWPEGDTDVDLWMMGPGEVNPIGYSNKGGRLLNLLRDDLGSQPDATPLNYESGYSRGAPPGEYFATVHCFRCPVVPVKVTAEIRSNQTDKGGKGTVVLFTSTLELSREGQERTIARFKLDAESNLIPGSIDFTHKSLRSAKSGDFGP